MIFFPQPYFSRWEICMCGALRKNLHIIPKGGIGLKLNFASFSTESLLQFTFVWTIIVPQKNTSSRGWVSLKADIRLNKIMGCKSPRCRRCKCRDGLPLTKVSHWRDPRRQTGDRLRHESEDLRECEAFCTRAMGREQRDERRKTAAAVGILPQFLFYSIMHPNGCGRNG